MKDLRSSWLLIILTLALGNLLGSESLQAQQNGSPLTLNDSTLNFGSVALGTSGYLSSTITSRGGRGARNLRVSVDNPAFEIVQPSFPLSIRSGESRRILIRFTPQSAGTAAAVVTIASLRHSTSLAMQGTGSTQGTGTASATLSASPGSISFGQVLKGKTQTQSATFTNSGTANIVLLQAASSNRAFQLSGPSLPMVLAPSQSAQFDITFSPQTAGAANGTLTMVSRVSHGDGWRSRRRWRDYSNTSIALSGMGAAAGTGQAALTASSQSLNFGSARVGASLTKSLTLANSGTAPVRIALMQINGAGFRYRGMNLPMMLQPGQSANVEVTFTPSAAGNQSGSLTIIPDGENPVILVSLSGNSPVPASGTLSANLPSLVFGTVEVGATKTQSGILTNSGSSTVTISQASVAGGAFKGPGLSLPLKLNPGQSTAFTVSFTPSVAGNSSGSVNFSSDASNSTLAVTLSGTAKAAAAPGVLTSSLSSLSFGSVQVGKTKTQSEIITNTGDTAITVSQASLSGAGFSIGGLSFPVNLTPGQSVSFNVTYAPAAAGASSGAISLVSNASNPNVGVSLSGTATAPTPPAVLAQSVSTLAFGNVQVGTSKTEPETLSNTGATALTISQAKISGSGYTVSGLALPIKLNPGQNTNFTVTYSPTSAGISSGSLVISSDASNPILAASLSGNATAAPNPGTLTASASSINFGSVSVGTSKSQAQTLKNTGESAVNISQANLTGVGYSLDGIYLPLQLNAGESFTFNVVFTPGAAANAAGSLTLISDASNILPAVSLSGSGAAAGKLSVSPASLSFGNVTVGSSKSLTSTLSAQNAGVTISSGELSDPEFTLSGASFPLTLSAGQSVALTLTFTPQSSGSAAGNLALSTSTSDTSITQALAGTGTAVVRHSVSLNWDGSASGFLVYRGAKSGGPYVRVTSSATTTSSFVDTAVQSGATYFYVTTSISASGEESEYSNEVEAVIPTP